MLGCSARSEAGKQTVSLWEDFTSQVAAYFIYTWLGSFEFCVWSGTTVPCHSFILLYREESRTIVLHNKGALPVSWRLQGIEELGDEFTVPQSYGIIGVASSFPLTLKFKSRRPLLVRKNLRLEVKWIWSSKRFKIKKKNLKNCL